MTTIGDIGSGVQISSTVVARAVIEATTGTPGVARFQPVLATVAGGIGRRIGELLRGRQAAGATDGVLVDEGGEGQVSVTLTIAIAGRRAADLAAELIDRVPARVETLCGVRPVLTVRITELVPGLIASGGHL